MQYGIIADILSVCFGGHFSSYNKWRALYINVIIWNDLVCD